MSIRVLMIVHDFPHAAQPFVLNQVIGLINLGCDLTIVAKRSAHPRGDPRVPEEVRTYQLFEKIIYLRPQVGPGIWAIFLTAMMIVSYAFRHPVRFVLAMMIAARTGDYSSLQILSRADVISLLGPIDVIHCQFGTAGNMGLLLRAVRAAQGAKVITSLRGSDISSVLRRKPRLYTELIREGDYFLPVCSHFKEVLRNMGVQAEKLPWLVPAMPVPKRSALKTR